MLTSWEEILSQSQAHKLTRPTRQRPRSSFHDLDLKNWKNYPELITDSLWSLGSRSKQSVHKGDYHGNFVPQIPEQVIKRFTKAKDVVLDLFCGMATTLIECRRLGRHGIGIELQRSVCQEASERLEAAENPYDITTSIICADSGATDIVSKVQQQLQLLGREKADHVLLHPPYWDIISFTSGQDERDLSALESLEDFLEAFERVATNAVELLEPGSFLTLVIGDKYASGEWIPLAFECMDIVRACGLTLRAINIKDIQGNEKAKGKNNNLWRYRALRNGLYVFKHEYVMLFRKS